MFTILFDVLFLGFIKSISPKDNTVSNRGNDVFIPFEDRVEGGQSKSYPPEEKTDYYPHDFDDFGDFE